MNCWMMFLFGVSIGVFLMAVVAEFEVRREREFYERLERLERSLK